ncbi:MAG: hypothetical protein AUI60_00315 [Thaumarchaeota archaeon 13_1_40CM_2_39_4]|nr:MAG: hypothetical protein AUI60_00315 [Thaumarchaeota archaeon 13_1_40CM_2_39_4]
MFVVQYRVNLLTSRSTLSIVLCGVLFSLLIFLGSTNEALGACTGPAQSGRIIFDDSSTGYVTNHGARINVTDSTQKAGQTIIAYQSESNGCLSAGANPLTLQLDFQTNHYYLASTTGSSPRFPTYLMLIPSGSNCDNKNCDPPTLVVPTMKYFTVNYTDTNNNKITSVPQLVVTDTNTVPSWAQANQPYFSTIINCSSGPRGGSHGDYICDNWKVTNGNCGASSSWSGLCIPIPAASGGTTYYKWSCGNGSDPLNPCPAVEKKDVYVEIDYMQNHRPSQKALLDISNVFKSQSTPVQLHWLIDEELPHYASITGPLNGAATQYTADDFNRIKRVHFGTLTERNSALDDCPVGDSTTCVSEILTAKRQAFHYMIMGHSQTNYPQSSGVSEYVSGTPFGASNDVLTSLGLFSWRIGSIDQQSGTIMHELGHGLGLGHGGPYHTATDPNVNCKPNYLSVMSWARQFSDAFTNPGGRQLDYSSDTGFPQHDVDERATAIMDESGVSTDGSKYTVFGINGGTGLSAPTIATNPDFDNENNIVGGILTEPASENDNVANGKVLHWESVLIATPGAPSNPTNVICPTDTPAALLHQWNDWNNLQYDMTTSTNWGD